MRGRAVILTTKTGLSFPGWRMPWTGAIRSQLGTHHEARYLQAGLTVTDPGKRRGAIWHRKASA